MEVMEIPFMDGRRNYKINDVRLDKLVETINKVIGKGSLNAKQSPYNSIFIPLENDCVPSH